MNVLGKIIKRVFTNETLNEFERLTKERDEFKKQKDDMFSEMVDLINKNKQLKAELEQLTCINTKMVGKAREIVGIGTLENQKEQPEKVPVVNEELIKSFETTLNSSNLKCRGGCIIYNPKTKETKTILFNSREEANGLLNKFKSGELILVD